MKGIAGIKNNSVKNTSARNMNAIFIIYYLAERQRSPSTHLVRSRVERLVGTFISVSWLLGSKSDPHLFIAKLTRAASRPIIGLIHIIFRFQRYASPSARPPRVSRNGAGDCWPSYCLATKSRNSLTLSLASMNASTLSPFENSTRSSYFRNSPDPS